MNLRLLRPFTAAWLSASLLLAGCSLNAPFFYSEWIEAPLVADGQTLAQGGDYAAWGKTLQVSASSVVPLKFSLSTLPNGTVPALRKDGDLVTQSTLPYSLTAAKVVKARLVFLVNQVHRPGYLAVDSIYDTSGDCYAQESAAPACSNTTAMAGRALDAGPSAQPLLVAHGGFHSVDVTELVKQRITQGSVVLRVRAAANPGDGSFADFELDSKDQDRFGSMVQGARLLISLSDAMGAPTNVQPYGAFTDYQKSNLGYAYNMRHDATDPATAHAIFQNTNPLLVQSPQAGDGAFFSFASSQFGAGQLRLLQGQQAGIIGIKQVGVLDIMGPVDGATVQPALQWHSVFRNMDNAPSWNSWGDSANTPPSGEPVAITALPIGQQAARVMADTSAALVQQTLDNLPLDADYAKTHYSVLAISANTGQALQVSNLPSARPRLITAIAPKPTQGVVMNFVDKESQPSEHLWCVGRYQDNTTCNPGGRSDYAVRARVGKPFETIQVMPYTRQVSLLPSASEIHLWAPPQVAGQPTALLNPDMANLGMGMFRQGSFSSPGGYIISAGTANRVVGQYTGYITRPGHNIPLPIYYENLPLPEPSLQGPAQLNLPLPVPGAGLAQEATFDFLVNDAVAQLDDDTIYWDFASSTASDSTPGTNIKQGDGSQAVRFGFQTPGPRRLSVTSRGDSTVTALIDVVVTASTATVLSSSSLSPVFGQPIELSAQVQSPYGMPQGLLALTADGVPLGRVALDASGQARFTPVLLAPGSHVLTAVYEGQTGQGLQESTSNAISINVLQAQSQTVLSLPSVFTPGVAIEAQVRVSALAPSLSTPGGEVLVQGAGGSCSVVLHQGVGSCTLRPTQGGAQTFTAAYPGDSRIAGSSASQAPAISKLQSQTSLQLPDGLKLGQSASLSASVTASAASTIKPGGSVVISGAGSSCTATLDNQGSASCAFTPNTAGKALAFSASYAGDDSFGGSSSTDQQAPVAGWASQLEIRATPNPVTARGEVVFELRVSGADTVPPPDAALRKAADAVQASPMGTVSLSDNGKPLGNAVALDSVGRASLRTRDLLQPGAHTIVASYSGDDSHEPASVSLVLEVNAAPDPTPVPTWGAWALALASAALLALVALVQRRSAARAVSGGGNRQ